jgi:ribosomal-protein-alanine N-acetyltransferase
VSATASDPLEHWRIPALSTDLLHLRRLRHGDEPFLVALSSDPEVTRYINDGAMSPDEALMSAEAEVKLARYRAHSGRWIVELPDSSPVGWVQLVKYCGPRIDNTLNDYLQIDYQLARQHWGSGFATEAGDSGERER